MQSALLIRLRPRGPWRYGPADGAHDGVDALYRSDRLYSAVTLSMQKLGLLEDWLEATARAPHPAIALSSLFPFQGDTLFAIPPASIWPPPPNQVTAPNPVFLAKIRWKSVIFVPIPVIDTLLTGGSILADQWLPDPESSCLLRRDRPSSSPMRVATRRSVPVDRLTRQAHAPSSLAAVEFESNAGLWALARFRDNESENNWHERLEGAFRLLADSGFGGRRSNGWGQSHQPEFTRGDWPGFVFPKLARAARDSSPSSRYWLLSLFVPGSQDAIDWSNGTYQIVTRAGRIENGAGSGVEKKSLRMIAEGSVLASPTEPAGTAVDVAPENFAHPVYRSGLALVLELPEITQTVAVEEPATEEAVMDRPCEPEESGNGASEHEGPSSEEAAVKSFVEPEAAAEPEESRNEASEQERPSSEEAAVKSPGELEAPSETEKSGNGARERERPGSEEAVVKSPVEPEAAAEPEESRNEASEQERPGPDAEASGPPESPVSDKEEQPAASEEDGSDAV